MHKRILTTVVIIASIFVAATAEARHVKKMMKVELLKMQEVKMEGGKTATVAVVKMNGHVMVGIPQEALPDSIREQLNCGERFCR